MVEIGNVSTVFSGRIELRDGQPVVEIPEREIELGDLSVRETHRIAIFRIETPSKDKETSASRSVQQPQTGSNQPPVQVGEEIEVEIEDLGEKGDGIARVGPGYIVFVPGTDLGDRVTARVDKVRENFAFAEVVKEEPVTADSPKRTVD